MKTEKNKQLDKLEDDIYRELRLLEEVEATPQLTQRHLAYKLGVALGVANLLLRTLARKGYIRANKVGWRRWVYAITPTGFKRKANLTISYVERFLDHYRRVRFLLQDQLQSLGLNTESRIAIFSTADLGELMILALKDMGVVEIDLFDGYTNMDDQEFHQEELLSFNPSNYDQVIVAVPTGSEIICRKLQAKGIISNQITTLMNKKEYE